MCQVYTKIYFLILKNAFSLLIAALRSMLTLPYEVTKCKCVFRLCHLFLFCEGNSRDLMWYYKDGCTKIYTCKIVLEIFNSLLLLSLSLALSSKLPIGILLEQFIYM